MGDAISKAIGDFDQKLIGLAQIGAGLALLLLGFSLLTGVGKVAVKTGIKVAKVVR